MTKNIVTQSMPVFNTIAERDKWFVANADHFVVGRRLGPREGYERHECATLPEAEALGRRMFEQTGKPYMVYAVSGILDCFVTAFK